MTVPLKLLLYARLFCLLAERAPVKISRNKSGEWQQRQEEATQTPSFSPKEQKLSPNIEVAQTLQRSGCLTGPGGNGSSQHSSIITRPVGKMRFFSTRTCLLLQVGNWWCWLRARQHSQLCLERTKTSITLCSLILPRCAAVYQWSHHEVIEITNLPRLICLKEFLVKILI